MRVVLSTSALIFMLCANAQNVTFHHNLLHRDILVGDTIVLNIKNESATASNFYFKYWRPGKEDIFLSTESYIEYLNDACGADSVEWSREIAYAQAEIYKQEFVNEGLLFNFFAITQADSISLFQKLYSTLGLKLGAHSIQCGEKATTTQIEFYATGKFPQGSVRVVTCDDHVLNDIWHQGKYALMDQDVTSHLHLYNWESFDELIQYGDTNWLNKAYWYGFTDINGDFQYPARGEIWMNKIEWLDVLKSAYEFNDAPPISETYNIDGDIILCSQCELIMQEVENHSLFFDFENPSDIEIYEQIIELNTLAQQDTALRQSMIDSVNTIVANYFNITPADAYEKVFLGEIKIANSSQPWFPNYGRIEVPTVKYIFPQRPEPYILGVDAKFPGWVTKVELNIGDTVFLYDVSLDDTLITAPFEVIFWGDSAPPLITNKSFHYMQNGFVDASEGNVILYVSYNPNLIGFFRDNINLLWLGGADDSLTINLHMPRLVVATHDVEASRGNDLIVYPNPANEIVFIEHPDNEEVTVLSLLGEVIKTCKGEDCKPLNISDLSSGHYILKTKLDSKLFIIE